MSHTAPVDLSIVIPCYNEAEGIPQIRDKLFPVLEKLSKHQKLEVILVDDGSSDDTYNLLKELASPAFDLRVLKHEKNKGLGAALRTGFAAALGALVISTDSDGTYSFEEIPKILDYMHPGIDIVTASPYHKNGGVENVPGYRLVLSRGASFMYELLMQEKIATYTSMFRAYRREVIKKVPFDSDGFLSVTELLVNAILMGYQVTEYPSVLRVRQTGTSKARLVRITKSHLKYQSHVLLTRLGLAPKPLPRE